MRVKNAKFDGEYLIIDIDSDEVYGLPQWRRQALVEKRPDYGQERRIFYPLYGRKAGMSALQDDAKVHNYRYKPYVDLDWLIQFESEENELVQVSFLLSVREKLSEIAENEMSKDI